MNNLASLPKEDPSLSIDFLRTGKFFPGSINLRTTSRLEYDQNNKIITLAPNELRISRDVETKEVLGFYPRRGTTNLFRYSSGLGDGSFLTTVNNNITTTAPDGSVISVIQDTSVNGEHLICGSTISTKANKKYVISTYIKTSNITLSGVGVGIRFVKATNSAPSGYSVEEYTCFTINGNSLNRYSSVNGVVGSDGREGYEYVGDGWWRVWRSFTALQDTSSLYYRIHLTRDSSLGHGSNPVTGLFVWGHMLEEGVLPSSLVKTSGSTVTSTGEGMVIPNKGALNTSEGTAIIEYVQPKSDGITRDMLCLAEEPFHDINNYSIRDNGEGKYFSMLNATGFVFTGDSPIPGKIVKAAIAYSNSQLAVSVNGVTQITARTDKPAVVPANILIGANLSGGGPNLSADTYIHRIACWPKMLTARELTSLTK